MTAERNAQSSTQYDCFDFNCWKKLFACEQSLSIRLVQLAVNTLQKISIVFKMLIHFFLNKNIIFCLYMLFKYIVNLFVISKRVHVAKLSIAVCFSPLLHASDQVIQTSNTVRRYVY